MAASICRCSITTNFLKVSFRTTIRRHVFTSYSTGRPNLYHQVKIFKKYWPYLGLATAGTIGYGLYKWNVTNKIFRIPSVEAKTIQSENLPPSRKFNFIADVVEAVQPAVVYIEVTKGRAPGFWDHYHTGPSSAGSGFFVAEEGLVLTNFHVVANARDVKVKLKDGREYKGVVVDLDPVRDLAAIRLSAPQGSKFPTINLGSSSSLRPGEWVIAMGSPLTLSNTVTAGIVSTVHRRAKELGGLNNDMEYVQTDAAINVGNSGGPLVNLDREVIGICAITMPYASGISFAIPVDAAKEFLERAEKKISTVQRGPHQRMESPSKRWYIGITTFTLLPQILEELKQRSAKFEKVSHGVLVTGIIRGSPAHVAGLRSGDVITQINGQKITMAKEVYEFVKQGEPLRLNIQRDSKMVSLTVKPELSR